METTAQYRPLRSLDGITPRKNCGSTSPQKRKLLHTLGTVAYYLRLPALGITLALVLLPFLPMLKLPSSLMQISQYIVSPKSQSVRAASLKLATLGNTLTISSIGLNNESILEGSTQSTLDKGIWHIPNSSTPDQGSNTVLAGHRYAYTTTANSFYFLPNVKTGDRITVTWAGKTYTYKVAMTEVVGSDQTSVENPTSVPTLTLFTCTPLLTGANRFVVQAVLQQ